MKKFIDYNATIQGFFDVAIDWLESQPVRLRNGENKAEITHEYLRMVSKKPFEHTVHNAVYANCDKLEGFIEQKVDKRGNLNCNSDLYFSVIRVMDAMGDYYEANHNYNRTKLLEAVKQFHIALNRRNLLKLALYKMKPAAYFAQKQK